MSDEVGELVLQLLNGLTGGRRLILLEHERFTCNRLDCRKHAAAVEAGRWSKILPVFFHAGIHEEQCSETHFRYRNRYRNLCLKLLIIYVGKYRRSDTPS